MPAVALREWQTLAPDTCPALAGLRLTDDPYAARLIDHLTQRRLMSLRELRTGVEVGAFSFVGSLTVGPLTISIRPKLEAAAFATLVGYGLGFPDIALLPEHTARPTTPAFQDIIIDRLADEASRLLARGLYRQYARQRIPLQSPRGRIVFTELARSGNACDVAVPCEVHVRDEDVLPNGVLLAGLQLAGRLALDPGVRHRTLRAAAALAERVQPARLDAATLRALARGRNRLMAAYEPALALVRLLMAGRGITTEEGAESFPLPGFLLNMNRLFQAAIGRFLRESLADIEIHEEHSLRELFAYREGFNPLRRRTPTPRPDFVFMKSGRVVAIADAKYRDLWEHELPRDMLYQLSIYALSQSQCRAATILYPATATAAREARVIINDPVSGAMCGEVCLRPLNVGRLTRMLGAARTEATRRARHDYAEYLAFGPRRAQV